MPGGFAMVWEFEIRSESREEFERHYASDGSWAQLFGRSPDFIGTLLLNDRDVPQRYLTIDRWRSEAAQQVFMAQHASAYAELDRECERLTLSERRLGAFRE